MIRRVNINGDFEVWQLGTTFNPAPHAAITADCWRIQDTTGAVTRVDYSSDAPSFALAGKHIEQSFKVTCVTPAASITPAEIGGIVYTGEGYAWRRLHGQPITQSFWVKASLPGVYHAGIRTGGAPYKTCTGAFTITTANVWQYVEINHPTAPTTGGWSFTKDIGFAMFFFLGGGANFVGTPGVWEDGPLGIGAGQADWLKTADATFQIADVQVEAGTSATPFEYRPFADTLRECQRFIEKSFCLWQPPASNLSTLAGSNLFHAPRPYSGAGAYQAPDLIRFAVPKRDNDYAVTFFNTHDAGDGMRNLSASDNLGAIAADAKSEFGFRAYAQGADLGDTLSFGWVVNASVQPG